MIKKILGERKILLALCLVGSLILIYFYVYINNNNANFEEAFLLEEAPSLREDNKIILPPLSNDIKIIRPIKNKITTGESKITFSGMTDPEGNTKLNGENLDIYYTGNFIRELPLDVGINNFKFSLGNKVLQYEIIREFKIINSILPSNILEIEDGMEAVISAKLYSGSSAYAEIDGEKIDLKQIETAEYINARDTTYANFQGVYKAKGSRVNEGKGTIKVHAIFDGKEETKEGARVIVNKIDSSDRSKLKEQIIVKNDSTRIYDNLTTSVTPLVEIGPLAKGTIDYIVSKIKVDDKEYYNLLSKKRLRINDVDVVNSVYFDNNTIRNIEVYESNNKIILKIKPEHKLPYNFEVIGIDFKDIKNQNYSIDSLNGEAIKLVFDFGKIIEDNISFKENFLFEDIKVEEGDSTNYLYLKIKDGSEYNGHYTYYDSDGNLIFQFRDKKKSLSGMKIIIDPGHGLTKNGNDPGALGWSNINESDLNLQIAKSVELKLKERGAEVIRLKTDTEIIPLKDRGAKSKEADADLFVSLHNNSGGSGKYNATETYYFTPISKKFAENINKSLVNCYNEVLFPSTKGNYNRGDKFNDFTVTLERESPSVLIEVGYVDNPLSFNKLIDPDYQIKLSEAIVNGIENSL
ncbi:N-acetylmuramoyl-L-alanine amidase family protein [Clostridium sp. LP20]|uniref:N-acetylmuramoyl-L-alanine amidase family protein n=1 Tax=Clostridium sp. LP20 TaxID=3418665 RepID=UPI003EE6B7BB